MAGPRIDEYIAFGIGGHAGCFAQLDRVRQLQRIDSGIEGNVRHRQLGRERDAGYKRRSQRELEKASHDKPPHQSYFAAEAEALADACGFRVIFCTRHDSISATTSSFGFRQSSMCTTWNPPACLLAWPNLPMIVPSNSIL